jgi:autotransporter-associated beta strand protein
MRERIRWVVLVLVWFCARATWGVPTVQTLTDSHGKYYLINNGSLSNFQLYTTGSLAGKITSIVYDGQQMVGGKAFYYDLQGSPNIYLGSAEAYSVRSGSNFVDISAFHAATATEPIDVTWHWILQDGQSAFSSYLTYHHTTAMTDWGSSENRLGAQFYNGNLFNYSSITDNFWGYQAAGDANRDQGRFITAETSDMRGIPSEYTKTYETKYDWRSTYAQSGGVTGIFGAANTSLATRATAASNYGAWTIENYRSYESWNAGPTHPQTPVADGASIIPSPPGSHFGGPSTVFTGNMDQTYGPILNYFNKGTDITSLRNDAKAQGSGSTLNNFYDSLNLPYYATTAQRGAVTGNVRLADGSSMESATVVLSAFDPAKYATDPISQEYQRRAAGYNYWINPSKDGTFNLTDVRPGTYRVTVIKPGNYREGTFDNITVAAGGTTNVGNFTWRPDVSGKGVFQVGTFDRTAAEFKHGSDYNNWLDTFNYKKDFPNGVNLTVNPANPFSDTQNWANNWGLNQMSPNQDFWSVNFNMASAPTTGATATITLAVADQQFINGIGALVYGTNGTSYNRVDTSFDHTADNAPGTFRSGDTSSRVLYRKLSFPASWLHAGNNKIAFHIVGGNMQWDAVRLDLQDSGTFSGSQWDGGSGNWSDATHWQTRANNYTALVQTGDPANSTSTTFADGATHFAPINSTATQTYYDAAVNGGAVNLDASASVQRLSLLSGTLNVASGTPTLTANDAFVFGGAAFNGAGTIQAQSTTAVSFANVLSGGAKINSVGAVTWLDGASVNINGTGSRWTTPGVTFGQTGPGALSLGSGGMIEAGGKAIVVGSQGTLSSTGGIVSAATLTNSGVLTSVGGTVTLSSTFTNRGTATMDGGLTSVGVVNEAGTLNLSGINNYTGATTINGGLVQFAALTSIGGSGTSVLVNAGGSVGFSPGVNNATFLARLNPASTGALAIGATDAATTFDFTSGTLAALPNLGLGAASDVTFSGNYIPAGGVFRLGGGNGKLTFSPLIAGGASVIVGNNGGQGEVVLNAANSYTGTTTIKGGKLTLATLANGGQASALGTSNNAATNLVLDGGTLATNAAAGSTDRLFTITQNGGMLDGSGASGMIFSATGSLVVSGSGNRTLTLTGTGTSNSFAPQLADPASGVTSLIKDGVGTWMLNSAAPTFSGDTTVLNGTLSFGPLAALPSGVGKGNLVVALSGNVNLSGRPIAINALNDGPAPASGPGPNGNGGGNIVNSGAATTLTLGNGDASGQFSGVISGNVSLVKTGNGTQIFSGDNLYSGTTTINAGTLQVGVGGTPSSFGPGDGGFRGKLGDGNIINNGMLVFNRGYFTTAANVISGTGALKQIANAQLVVGTANSYTGPTTIGGGIANIGQGGATDGTGLAYTGDSSLNASVLANGGAVSSIGASTSDASNLILDGGTLYYTGPTTTTNRLFTVTPNGGVIYASGAITMNNGGPIVMSGTGDRTLSLAGDATASSTFGNDIGDPTSGKTSLTKDRSGTWIVAPTAALTYSGDTNMLMGTLTLGTGAALPFGTGKGNVVFTTSTDFNSVFDPKFELNGNDANINGLSGATTTYGSVDNNVGTHKLTLGNNDTTATFSGAITGGINLVKVGAGTQTVQGTNSYTGTTTVNGGTFVVNSALANNDAAHVFIAAPSEVLASNPTLTRKVSTLVTPGSYAGLGATSVGGRGTTATILFGQNSTGTDDAVSMQFRQRTTTGSGSGVSEVQRGLDSDVLGLSGMVNDATVNAHQTDLFVLQMSYDPALLTGNENSLIAQRMLYLGYLNETTGIWQNAINGNIGGNDLFLGNVAWNSSFTTLGQWGVDAVNNVAWAVLDHNSQFAVVPEPTSLLLLAAGVVTSVAWRQRRRVSASLRRN